MKGIIKLSAIALLLLCALPSALFAQDEDADLAQMEVKSNPHPDRNHIINVFIGDFTYTPQSHNTSAGSKVLDVIAAVATGEVTQYHDGRAESVRSNLVRGLSWSFRLRVMDRPFEPDMDDPKYAILVDGTIGTISTTSKVETYEVQDPKDKKKKIKKTRELYRADVTVLVNIKSITDGHIINTVTFRSTDSQNSYWYNTRDESLNKAIERLPGQVRRYFDSCYPLYATIIERAGERNNRQKEVYIDLGSAHRLYEGLTFGVYKRKIVAGREAHTYLGRIKVKKIEGPDVTFCKVVSGGKDIKNCLDIGEELTIVSRH